jgi:hypothetical protein
MKQSGIPAIVRFDEVSLNFGIVGDAKCLKGILRRRRQNERDTPCDQSQESIPRYRHCLLWALANVDP